MAQSLLLTNYRSSYSIMPTSSQSIPDPSYTYVSSSLVNSEGLPTSSDHVSEYEALEDIKNSLTFDDDLNKQFNKSDWSNGSQKSNCEGFNNLSNNLWKNDINLEDQDFSNNFFQLLHNNFPNSPKKHHSLPTPDLGFTSIPYSRSAKSFDYGYDPLNAKWSNNDSALALLFNNMNSENVMNDSNNNFCPENSFKSTCPDFSNYSNDFAKLPANNLNYFHQQDIILNSLKQQQMHLSSNDKFHHNPYSGINISMQTPQPLQQQTNTFKLQNLQGLCGNANVGGVISSYSNNNSTPLYRPIIGNVTTLPPNAHLVPSAPGVLSHSSSASQHHYLSSGGGGGGGMPPMYQHHHHQGAHHPHHTTYGGSGGAGHHHQHHAHHSTHAHHPGKRGSHNIFGSYSHQSVTHLNNVAKLVNLLPGLGITPVSNTNNNSSSTSTLLANNNNNYHHQTVIDETDRWANTILASLLNNNYSTGNNSPFSSTKHHQTFDQKSIFLLLQKFPGLREKLESGLKHLSSPYSTIGPPSTDENTTSPFEKDGKPLSPFMLAATNDFITSKSAEEKSAAAAPVLPIGFSRVVPNQYNRTNQHHSSLNLCPEAPLTSATVTTYPSNTSTNPSVKITAVTSADSFKKQALVHPDYTLPHEYGEKFSSFSGKKEPTDSGISTEGASNASSGPANYKAGLCGGTQSRLENDSFNASSIMPDIIDSGGGSGQGDYQGLSPEGFKNNDKSCKIQPDVTGKNQFNSFLEDQTTPESNTTGTGDENFKINGPDELLLMKELLNNLDFNTLNTSKAFVGMKSDFLQAPFPENLFHIPPNKTQHGNYEEGKCSTTNLTSKSPPANSFNLPNNDNEVLIQSKPYDYSVPKQPPGGTRKKPELLNVNPLSSTSSSTSLMNQLKCNLTKPVSPNKTVTNHSPPSNTNNNNSNLATNLANLLECLALSSSGGNNQGEILSPIDVAAAAAAFSPTLSDTSLHSSSIGGTGSAAIFSGYDDSALSPPTPSNTHQLLRRLHDSPTNLFSPFGNSSGSHSGFKTSPRQATTRNPETARFHFPTPYLPDAMGVAEEGPNNPITQSTAFPFVGTAGGGRNSMDELSKLLLTVLANTANSVNLGHGLTPALNNPNLSETDRLVALMYPNCSGLPSAVPYAPGIEKFSRKVFVGGLPPDIDEEEICNSFRHFGPLVVDWPHKAESKSFFPPKGYAFLLFHEEPSIQALVEACYIENGKHYLYVSSPTIKDKPVQIRAWNLNDADFVLDSSQPLDPRKTIFVGGVPRPLRALELALIMDRLYGNVCYAGIDTDPELKYPKGAGRVAFGTKQSYVTAISARFVQLQHGDIDKRVEVKPYVLDDQICDECFGIRCMGKVAPFFCANVSCLKYFCEPCWAAVHSRPGKEFHKPLVKEGGDRPRMLPYRIC